MESICRQAKEGNSLELQQSSQLEASILNLFSSLLFPLQGLLSMILEWLLTLWIVKLFLAKDDCQQDANPINYKIDKRKTSHRFVHFYLSKMACPLKQVISGTKTGMELYESLLSSDVKIIFRGIKKSDASTIITIYKKEQPNPEDYMQVEDYILLVNTKFGGKFKLIDKRLENGNIIARCVWISGESKGKVFEVNPKFFENGKDCPDYFYQIPVWFNYILKAFVLISSIIVIWSTTADGWKHIYYWVARLFSHIY